MTRSGEPALLAEIVESRATIAARVLSNIIVEGPHHEFLR